MLPVPATNVVEHVGLADIRDGPLGARGGYEVDADLARSLDGIVKTESIDALG